MAKGGKKSNKKKNNNKQLLVNNNDNLPVSEPIPAEEKAIETAENGVLGPVCTTSQV